MEIKEVLYILLGAFIAFVFNFLLNKIKRSEDFKDSLLSDLIKRVGKNEQDINEAYKIIRSQKQ